MPDLLTVHAETSPDKIAVVDDRGAGSIRTRTYAELEARSNRLAHVLIEHGVRPGDKVVWCGQNSVGIVEVVNASRKIGSTAVPLNYRLSDDIADVAADLYHGLAHFKAGRADEALWWWQYSYLANWGSTASSALRALHSAVAHTRLDASAEG